MSKSRLKKAGEEQVRLSQMSYLIYIIEQGEYADPAKPI